MATKKDSILNRQSPTVGVIISTNNILKVLIINQQYTVGPFYTGSSALSNLVNLYSYLTTFSVYISLLFN